MSQLPLKYKQSISLCLPLTCSPTIHPKLLLYTFYSTLTLKIGENNSCASWVSETGIITVLSEPALHLRRTPGFPLFFSILMPFFYGWEISQWFVLSWRDDEKWKLLIYIFSHVNQRLWGMFSCFRPFTLNQCFIHQELLLFIAAKYNATYELPMFFTKIKYFTGSSPEM